MKVNRKEAEMGKFYEFDLHEAGCLTYVVLPVWGLLGVVTYLENHHIPYEVGHNWYSLDPVSDGYYFLGERGREGIYIRSGMDPDELLTLAEGTFYIPFSEIGDKYCPVPARYAGCMPADLWEDDRSDFVWEGGSFYTAAEWLDQIYDHSTLDEEGALALTRWFYELLKFPIGVSDALYLRPWPHERQTIASSMYVGNFDQGLYFDADGGVIAYEYYGADGKTAWAEDGMGNVILGVRPRERDWCNL